MRKRGKLQVAMATLVLAVSLCFSGGTVQATSVKNAEVQQEVDSFAAQADLTISSVRELKEFSTKVANGNSYEGKTVVLTSDIAFDGRVGNFAPISGFAGTFDGQGHTISGINVKTNESGYVALFTELWSAGEIKNLIIKDCIFESQRNYTQYVAGMVAYNDGVVRNCNVLNSEISGNNNDKYGGYYGGIVGYNYQGRIINCCSNGNTIHSTWGTKGGICGYNQNLHGYEDEGRIENCCNLSQVSGSDIVGGIVGTNSSSGLVRNCYNVGTVTYTGTEENPYVGGIVGYSKGNVIYCYTSEEAAELNFGSMTGLEEGNKAYPASFMQTAAFTDMLNADLSYCDEWISWEIRSESPYPLPMKMTDINNCNKALSEATCTYNGKAQTPSVALTYNGKALKQDVDYTVEYANNVNVGTATVTITGKGIFMGTTSLSFEIGKANQSFSYTSSYKKTYGNKSFYVNARLSNGNGKLSYSSSDNKVATVNSSGKVTFKKVGKVVITIKAAETSNYNAAQVQANLTITPNKQKVKSASISGRKLKVTWTKDAQASGYEVQYATNKKFTKNLKTVKIKKKQKISYKSKKLKKKTTYYVRVRAYKGSIYGGWSKAVKVKQK